MRISKQSDFQDFSVRTTDATQTNLATVNIPNNSGKYIRAAIKGVLSDGTKMVDADLIRGYKNASGTVSAMGSTTSNHWESDDGAYAIDFVISGTSVIIKVTGKAGETINWYCRVYTL